MLVIGSLNEASEKGPVSSSSWWQLSRRAQEEKHLGNERSRRICGSQGKGKHGLLRPELRELEGSTDLK